MTQCTRSAITPKFIRLPAFTLLLLLAFPLASAAADVSADCATNLKDLLRRHVYVKGRCDGKCLVVTRECEITYTS